MKDVTISAAPQAWITDDLYAKWMETRTGTKDGFLRFMTVPSIDRDLFLDSLECSVVIVEGIGMPTYSI